MKRFLLILLLLSIILFPNKAWAVSKVEGKWEEVALERNKLLEDSGDNIVVNYELAVAYANLGKIEQATEIFKSLDENKGKKVLKETIPKYKMIVEKNSNDIIDSNYLAFAYYIMKDYQDSKELFDRLVKLDSENIWTYNYLAVVEHELKNYNQAEKALKKSLEIEENEYTHFLLGANYYKKGKIFKALYHIGKGGKGVSLFLN
jgi:tetratricopeptide (TPR) repeat protein